MISIVFGDEPYGMDVKKRKVIDQISMPAMNLSFYTGEFSLEIFNMCNTFPFMDEKRAVVLEVDALNKLDNDIFKDYCNCPCESTELLIIAKEVDRRTSIYKVLNDKGFMVPCMKLKNVSDLKKILVYELKKRNASMKTDAAELFIKKMNYFDNDEVNLLNVVGYLDACACISSTITTEIVDQVCPSFEEADIFILTSLIKDNKADELYRQIMMIPSIDNIGVLSLLLRDFRVAYKLKYFDSNAVATRKTAFTLYPTALLYECMRIITTIIAGIKNGGCPKELALLMACAQIVSATNAYKENRNSSR